MNELYKKIRALTKAEDVEKKKTGNGIALDYISWATAWDAVSQEATIKRVVYERDDGRNYWDDGKTAWVKVGISVGGGEEQIEYLPIMGFKNDALTLERITAMEVNKAIQRCTVKALARACGYGIQVYIGEDLPSEEDGSRVSPSATITPMQVSTIMRLAKEAGLSVEDLKARYGTLKGIDQGKANSIIISLESEVKSK